MAAYRSFRDACTGRAAVDGRRHRRDSVYADLVFALPDPAATRRRRAVCLGVMDYHGGYADRGRTDEVHADTSPRSASPRLLDEGWRVRVLIGDQGDAPAVALSSTRWTRRWSAQPRRPRSPT